MLTNFIHKFGPNETFATIIESAVIRVRQILKKNTTCRPNSGIQLS